ncbi:hypothetical protein SDC9_200654 [bioreactor metagenome]|uniref:Uncharacterized protein n=1 Tax=bioreactor metagenome TaxID=1076179 RepID=A0A645INU1_9ZZZZ
MAVGDVDGDVFGADAVGDEAVHCGIVGRFHAQRDRCEAALGLHVLDELDVVQIEAVHDVEVAVLGQPGADFFIDHRLHVGGHDRQAEAAAAQFDAGVAFRAALHAALARQQKDVVVVEDFHEIPSSFERVAAEGCPARWALGLKTGFMGAGVVAAPNPAVRRHKKPGCKKLGPGA